MKLVSGIVDLSRLHQFVHTNRDCYLERHTRKGTKGLKAYSELRNEITASVEESCGVYLWGYYERGLWRNVYFGCAGFGKTACLRTRLREELWDEKCFCMGTSYWQGCHSGDS